MKQEQNMLEKHICTTRQFVYDPWLRNPFKHRDVFLNRLRVELSGILSLGTDSMFKLSANSLFLELVISGCLCAWLVS